VAITISLVAGGFVWWSRTQTFAPNRAILMAVNDKPAVRADSGEKQDQAARRRAA
jgi:hypothetical protein